MIGMTTVLWCATCDEPGRREGGQFVHAATGQAEGPDGHRAAPTSTDPAMKAEAKQITAEYGGTFMVTAQFGFLRADWAHVPPGVTAQHYEAGNGTEMRATLRSAVRNLENGTPQ
jgi:hypothetical protein